MGEVIHFPTRSVRDWLTIERAMDEALSNNSVSPTVHARLVERMKAFYQTLELDFRFSVDVEVPELSDEERRALLTEIGEKIGAVSGEKLQAFTHKLFFERLAVEMDLCRALNI
jgi:hypothetical protein